MKTLLTTLFLFWSTVQLYAGDTIRVANFGLQPNSRVNAVPYLQKALAKAAEKPGSVILLDNGRYDFWPQQATEREYHETNTYDINPKILAVFLEKVNNLTIDGRGAELIMHGRMQPFTLDHCTNITLKNFSIDWEIPLTAQGEVVTRNSHSIDLAIDRMQYPYIIENSQLTFVGEGWKSAIWSIMQFDLQTHLVLPNTGDNLGWGKFEASEVKPGLVRLHARTKELADKLPQPGTLLVLRHSWRDHAGLFIFHSTNTTLENLHLHHTCGLGILSQYSQDLTFTNVHIVPNAAKKRVFSGHDDGFHFMGCSGLIKVERCSWAGLMDDPINIHGTCSRITEIISPTRIKCQFMHDMSEGMEWGRSNEQIGFIDHRSMRTVGTTTMRSFQPLSKTEFIIDLSQPLPPTIVPGDAIENLTCTPNAEIRHCHFGSCRARGLLISTPGKVVVEKNIFESSGSAILIAGDANAWYESGAVKDVLIRENEFRYPCNSSPYQFCEAVISIFPEIPAPDKRYPYHRNIRITNNTFHLFDAPILYARSVEGLDFSHNTLIRDTTYQPLYPHKAGITLEYCKKVTIRKNRKKGSILGQTIHCHETDSKELRKEKNSFFKKQKK